ncbi:hypothetical protein OAQ56_02130 [Alphaproteobacteria bacterium]|nr:hypothetical protein [Alphaproteobacteria bacterium]
MLEKVCMNVLPMVPGVVLKQKNNENFIPLMKEKITNFTIKFECKFTVETGISSPELTKSFE